jgi:hypothetical protein
MNSKMMSLDWKWLTAIAGGQAENAPKLQRDKLLALNFIIARHRKDSFALTGLGSDALLRRKYKLGLPEAEPSVAPQPVAVADEVEGLEPSEVAA